MNFIFVASTNGSVLKSLLESGSSLLNNVECVVSDRDCGAIKLAKLHGFDTKVFKGDSGAAFSESLYNEYSGRDNIIFVSFYTRIFSGNFLEKFTDRIINFHPSILPACPGSDGFFDTLKSGSQFIGATVHFVDEGIDTGKPILQSCVPYNPLVSEKENRHRIYLQQCIMLRQVLHWFLEGRICTVDGRVIVKDAKYLPGEFSPNIEVFGSEII